MRSAQQGMEARIFNPALYPEIEVESGFSASWQTLHPTHVGFVCHWQETAHGLLAALAMVREWNPAVVTLCGGFTASYFAESLLATVRGLGLCGGRRPRGTGGATYCKAGHRRRSPTWCGGTDG